MILVKHLPREMNIEQVLQVGQGSCACLLAMSELGVQQVSPIIHCGQLS